MSATRRPATGAASRRARRLLEFPGARGDDREAQLLAIGERLVTEGVFNETPISAIAAEAGLSRPGFYFYFASKDELLSELVGRTLEQALQRLVGKLDDPEEDPRTLIRYIVQGSAAMWVDHAPVLCAAVELVPRVPAVRDQWLRAVADFADALAKLIVDHTEVPELREAAKARDLAETLVWGFERNFYVMAFQGGGPDRHERLVETTAATWSRAMGLCPSS